MSFIEQKVVWNGNGIVRIKERSMLQSVWRFCKRCERQLFLVIKGTVIKSSAIQRIFLTEKQTEKRNEQSMPGNQSQPITQPTSQQVQTVAQQPATAEIITPQARLMGVLTEIRRYTTAEHTAEENPGDQGGLQQLLPALSGYCSDRWLVLVSPPQRPDVNALSAAGIDPSRVLLVHVRGSSNGLGDNRLDNGLDNGLDKQLKVVERALQSGTCGAVVAWLEACDKPALQRLRCAAVAGQAWGVMFREGEGDLAMPSMSKTIAPLADEVRRSAYQESSAQIVDIYSGLARPSAYLTKQLAWQAQEKEAAQLEMAIN